MGVRDNLVLLYGLIRPWSKTEFLFTLCRNLSKEDLATICNNEDLLNQYETVRNKPLLEFQYEEWFEDAAEEMMDVVEKHHDFIMDKLCIPKYKFKLYQRHDTWDEVYLVLSRIQVHEWYNIAFDIRNGTIKDNNEDSSNKEAVPLPTSEEDRMLRHFSKKYQLKETDISFMCLHYHS